MYVRTEKDGRPFLLLVGTHVNIFLLTSSKVSVDARGVGGGGVGRSLNLVYVSFLTATCLSYYNALGCLEWLTAVYTEIGVWVENSEIKLHKQKWSNRCQ